MTKGSGSPDPNRKQGEIIGGGSSSFSAKMMRQIVEMAPSSVSQVDLSQLPEVPMPSLEGLEIHVPAPPPLAEQEVMDRYRLMYYNHCVNRNIRKIGEPIQMGDELLLDMLGYLEGRVLPFSAHKDLVLRLEADIIQPGFGNSIVGTPVGDTAVVTISMPEVDEFGQARDLTAAFVVEVKGAASLDFPKIDAPETIAKFNLGKTLDEVYRAIAERITEERGNAMFTQGVNMALDAAAQRIKVPIPPKLVQDEIRQSWNQSEGRFLLEKGLTRQDMDSALEAWLSDENLQNDARKRLKISMLLLAAAREETQGLEPSELEGFVEQFAESSGINIEAWREAVKDNQEAQAAIIESYIHIRTIMHIVAKIPIHYGT